MDSSEALLQKANEITRKFLAGQYISDDDYKFSVMLNLAALPNSSGNSPPKSVAPLR